MNDLLFYYRNSRLLRRRKYRYLVTTNALKKINHARISNTRTLFTLFSTMQNLWLGLDPNKMSSCTTTSMTWRHTMPLWLPLFTPLRTRLPICPAPVCGVTKTRTACPSSNPTLLCRTTACNMSLVKHLNCNSK